VCVPRGSITPHGSWLPLLSPGSHWPLVLVCVTAMSDSRLSGDTEECLPFQSGHVFTDFIKHANVLKLGSSHVPWEAHQVHIRYDRLETEASETQ
jgi:hypothetical protein